VGEARVEVPRGDGGPRRPHLSWGEVEVEATVARLGPESVVVLA
jgi:hypothetical protein